MLDRLRCWLFGHKPRPSVFRFVRASKPLRAGEAVYVDQTSRIGPAFRLCQRCGGRVHL